MRVVKICRRHELCTREVSGNLRLHPEKVPALFLSLFVYSLAIVEIIAAGAVASAVAHGF
ncbi:MAG: hypothetical protein COT74_09625 [Bdellovibrionales bacterium CG10_big_fil_rev_8_21_14_0_10_45_34]|nr:MAG: hypothetical protein COT74_09625 [Bdellovibrionales bacterium CG10_big_fil_rev_8_21_14_0_10_45_34]